MKSVLTWLLSENSLLKMNSFFSEDYEERPSEPVPVCVQEYCKDPSQQFYIFRCIALLTDKVNVG